MVQVEGRLSLRGKAVGIQARIVSSRQGEVGSFALKEGACSTEVQEVSLKKGDTLDFVVESMNPKGNASFGWAPKIRVQDYQAAEQAQETYEWHAESEFDGPPPPRLKGLDAWGKFAQVLLLSNETVFVN